MNKLSSHNRTKSEWIQPQEEKLASKEPDDGSIGSNLSMMEDVTCRSNRPRNSCCTSCTASKMPRAKLLRRSKNRWRKWRTLSFASSSSGGRSTGGVFRQKTKENITS